MALWLAYPFKTDPSVSLISERILEKFPLLCNVVAAGAHAKNNIAGISIRMIHKNGNFKAFISFLLNSVT
jgi:hypothetical protein